MSLVKSSSKPVFHQWNSPAAVVYVSGICQWRSDIICVQIKEKLIQNNIRFNHIFNASALMCFFALFPGLSCCQVVIDACTVTSKQTDISHLFWDSNKNIVKMNLQIFFFYNCVIDLQLDKLIFLLFVKNNWKLFCNIILRQFWKIKEWPSGLRCYIYSREISSSNRLSFTDLAQLLWSCSTFSSGIKFVKFVKNRFNRDSLPFVWFGLWKNDTAKICVSTLILRLP